MAPRTVLLSSKRIQGGKIIDGIFWRCGKHSWTSAICE